MVYASMWDISTTENGEKMCFKVLINTILEPINLVTGGLFSSHKK